MREMTREQSEKHALVPTLRTEYSPKASPPKNLRHNRLISGWPNYQDGPGLTLVTRRITDRQGIILTHDEGERFQFPRQRS